MATAITAPPPANLRLLDQAHGNRQVLTQLIAANHIPADKAEQLMNIFDRAKALLARIPKESSFLPMDRDFSQYPAGLHPQMEDMRSFCLYPKLMIHMLASGYCMAKARSFISEYIMDKPDEPTIDASKFSSWLQKLKQAQSRR